MCIRDRLSKIKKFIGRKNNGDIIISLREYDEEYVAVLDKSIELAEKGDEIISMTMEEFLSYTPSKAL